jgi:hypothetical protein
MSERRHESRFLCADLVKVEWVAHNLSGGVSTDTNSKQSLCATEAVLEDISRVGACVQVDEPIPPGATILISTGGEGARLAGQVSYCVFRDYGYFVGIRFSDETMWTSGVFAPQHLTSLEALAMQPD